uniref:Uncharacterized protein n=1 Tax=Anguilla anguilla TaxID=7936 RepID=A0A0E9SHG0_ANGAN
MFTSLQLTFPQSSLYCSLEFFFVWGSIVGENYHHEN